MAHGDDDPRAIFDAAAFERQTGGDADLRSEIIQMFLEDCPMRVAEIHAAIDAGNAAALVSSAHALKGSAAYLSASIVRARAADLERLGREGNMTDAVATIGRLDGANGINKDEISLVEPGVFVIDQLVGRRRHHAIRLHAYALGANGSHVQPNRS